MKMKPKASAVRSFELCKNCAEKTCVLNIGDIKIPCSNLKRIHKE